MATKKGAAVVIDLIKVMSAASVRGGGAEVTQIAVGGTSGSVWTESIALPRNAIFCVNLKATGTTVKLVVDLENSNQVPTTEQAIDANWVIPDGKAEIIADLTDELKHSVAYSPAATSFARVKITKGAGNDAGTVLDKLEISYIPAN